MQQLFRLKSEKRRTSLLLAASYFNSI